MKYFGVILAAVLVFGLSIPMLEQSSKLSARTSTVYVNDFTLSPSGRAYVGDVVTFFANATSNAGATTLNFTIYYDYYLANGSVNPNSPVSVDTTPNPGSIITTYVYNAPGNCTYTDDNQYVIRLVINDGMGGWRNLTRYVKIVINEPPEFNPPPFGIIPWEIGVPLNLSVLCFDEDNDNLTLTWDFGDGSETMENVTGPALSGVYCNQTHTWNPSAEELYGISDYIQYYVSMSLTDGWGHWTNATTEIFLSVEHNLSPSGVLTTNSSIVDPADEVWFIGKASDPEGEPLTWTFVFNNSEGTFLVRVFHTGLTAPNATVYVNTSYVFSEVGDYQVSLLLSDISDPELQNDPNRKDHNISVKPVTVNCIENRVPFAGKIYVEDFFTGSQDVVFNETIGVAIAVFTVQVRDEDGEVLSATWDFGDGTEAGHNLSAGGTDIYDLIQIHEYSTCGEFNVSVNVTDGREGHDVQRYVIITVTSSNLPPELTLLQVSFSEPRGYAFVGEEVWITAVFTDQEEDPLELEWDFGDGTPKQTIIVTEYVGGSATASIMHVYSVPGIAHRGTLNYTDNELLGIGEHELQWIFYVVVVLDYKLPVADAGDNQTIVSGETAFFDGTGSSDNWGIENYTWTLTYNGTEEYLWGPTPSFEFWTPGQYLVTLEVTDYAGNKDTATVNVLVLSEEIPEIGSLASLTATLALLVLVITASVRRRRRR